MTSERKIRELIKDEKESAKMYRKMGLPTIARDESRHKRILMRRLEKS